MAVTWRLQAVLKKQGLETVASLQQALIERLGLHVSRQALQKLLKQNPIALRLQTAQMLCDLLQVPLSELLEVQPNPVIPPSTKQPPHKPYAVKKQKPPDETNIFRTPEDFW